MTERIFVADGTRGVLSDNPELRKITARERSLTAISAYLYYGWEHEGWGIAPSDSNLRGMTGFYFFRRDDSTGPGFGADVLCDRLRSGLYAAIPVTGTLVLTVISEGDES